MPATHFFSMLAEAETLEYENRSAMFYELCDIMAITNTLPEYKTELKKIYQKRAMGDVWKDPEDRVFDSDNKHAVAWMENVFKQANKVLGQH